MSSANQTEWDVFISYRRSDGTPIARRVRIELEKFTFISLGYGCWLAGHRDPRETFRILRR
jgi:hypothetical protein